jgi:hypothetical protein
VHTDVIPPLAVPNGQNTAGTSAPITTPLDPEGIAEDGGSDEVGQTI